MALCINMFVPAISLAQAIVLMLSLKEVIPEQLFSHKKPRVATWWDANFLQGQM